MDIMVYVCTKILLIDISIHRFLCAQITGIGMYEILLFLRFTFLLHLIFGFYCISVINNNHCHKYCAGKNSIIQIIFGSNNLFSIIVEFVNFFFFTFLALRCCFFFNHPIPLDLYAITRILLFTNFSFLLLVIVRYYTIIIYYLFKCISFQ